MVAPVRGHTGRHQAQNPLIPMSRFPEPPLQIPRAPAMASTIDHDNPMARAQKGRNLMCSVAAVAKAAMQQDNGRTFTDVGVADAGAAVLDVVRPLRRR